MQNNMLLSNLYSLLALIGSVIYTPHELHNRPRNAKLDGHGPNSLPEFGAMIYCTTGNEPLIYDDYGCWCGFGGSGAPVDGIDACCRDHDHCYDYGAVHNCSGGLDEMYAIPYLFWCYKNPKQGHRAICSKHNVIECAKKTCSCDAAAAKCFAQFKPQKKFEGYNKSLCH